MPSFLASNPATTVGSAFGAQSRISRVRRKCPVSRPVREILVSDFDLDLPAPSREATLSPLDSLRDR